MITSRTINIATLTIEDKEDFKRNLAYTIDCCFCEEMQKRSDGKLTYTGVQTILARVRTFFKEQPNATTFAFLYCNMQRYLTVFILKVRISTLLNTLKSVISCS